MPHYKYLILGGGMTADAAVDGIRQMDPQGSIGLISAESHPPYDRPSLSKGLWIGKPVEKIWRKTEQKGAEVHLRRQAEEIDVQGKQVVDSQGEIYTYDRLLIATGGTPRQLPFGRQEITYFRTLDDYQGLQQRTEQGGRFAVIGGGFIGSEIAAALAMAGQKVSMVFPEAGIGSRLFPAELADFLNDYYRDKGVDILAGELITGLEHQGEKRFLKTKSGREIPAVEVVAGIGIRPNIELAEAAGLRVADGVWVDEYLRTSQPDIYAAGDVAYFYNPVLDTRLRVEHEDNANRMGLTAGLNMAGEPTPYHDLPYFYSDLFDLGYEAVGELNPELETFVDWQEPYKKGVVYYLKDKRVRGVLLWNTWDQVEAARRLIAETGPVNTRQLKGRLPE